MVETPYPATAKLRDACRNTHADTFGHATLAVTQKRWQHTLGPIRLLRERAEMLPHAVVADALHAGLDWWQIADHLNLHPQDAWELYRNAAQGLASPAEQRPGLAVWLWAGADIVHEFDPAYGVELGDLPTTHSLHDDPTVSRLRVAAALLCVDIWIAVHPHDEPAPSLMPGAVAASWTSVTSHAQEIADIRHALAARSNGARSLRIAPGPRLLPPQPIGTTARRECVSDLP